MITLTGHLGGILSGRRRSVTLQQARQHGYCKCLSNHPTVFSNRFDWCSGLMNICPSPGSMMSCVGTPSVFKACQIHRTAMRAFRVALTDND